MADSKTEVVAASAEILAVDDTPENLKALVGILGSRGYRVRPVSSGAMALQAAQAEPPDLVLLDVNMPGMDGYAVCRALKLDPRLAQIPILFLSAITEPINKVEAFAAGGVDYITKPFSIEEVEARVKTHVELHRSARALQASYEKLRELETMRDNLVHMIVHDMRSPLTALILFLESFRQEASDRLEDQSLEDIVLAIGSGKRISRMANDLLDVSRLEEGKMPVERRDCDLSAVVRQAVENVRAMDPDREVRVDEVGPIRASCDASLVLRVVENLVSNGLKHTPAGRSISLSVSEQANVVRVAVKDQGAGVPEALREKIFEKFGALTARTEQRFHSVGLGLAFCKLAVEAHGGRIGVTSGEGEGSTFWFTLPR